MRYARRPLNTIRDVVDLPRDITPDEVKEYYTQDPEDFGLLCVAQAARVWVPPGVTQLLQSPEFSGDWVEELVLQRSTHQLAWCRRYHTLGPGAPGTVNASETLLKIRKRLKEARKISTDHLTARRLNPVQARARDMLFEAHRDEVEELREDLMRRSGLAEEVEITPAAQRLLDMPYKEFRNLVACDIQDRVEEDGLGHVAVTRRWREALVDLGKSTFDQLGLPYTENTVTRFFPVPDEFLEGIAPEVFEDHMRRLIFLAHLRTRMIERGRIRKQHSRRLSELVYEPVEDHMTTTYFAEYAGYRLQADKEVVNSEVEEPGFFFEFKELMDRGGWRAEIVRKGSRIWLEGRRGDERRPEHALITVARRDPNDPSGLLWTEVRYFALTENGSTYASLPNADAMKVVLLTPGPYVAHPSPSQLFPWRFWPLTGVKTVKRFIPARGRLYKREPVSAGPRQLAGTAPGGEERS